MLHLLLINHRPIKDLFAIKPLDYHLNNQTISPAKEMDGGDEIGVSAFQLLYAHKWSFKPMTSAR